MWGSYCEDVLEKRTPYRQAHLDGLAQQRATGVLVTMGPTKDLTKVFGIYDAPDEVTVRQLVEADPYWQKWNLDGIHYTGVDSGFLGVVGYCSFRSRTLHLG